MGTLRWRRIARLGVALGISWVAGVACGMPHPENAPSPRPDIVRRHWDQACRDGGAPTRAVQVSELFDTVGLGAELASRGLRVPTRVGASPRVDYVVRYRGGGDVLAEGVWTSNVSDHLTSGIGEVLSSRVRSPGSLLRSEGFRVRLTLTPWPRLALASPVECMPHMIHYGGDRPLGLPDTVWTWAGGSRLREGNDSTVTVDLVIDEEGSVLEVSRREGTEAAFAEARRVIARLRFDPPLRNGEPVLGRLRQTFQFRRRPAG